MNNKDSWLFLFLIGTLLFNWPFLDIFNRSLPYYLFSIWAIFIFIVGFFVKMVTPKKNKDV